MQECNASSDWVTSKTCVKYNQSSVSDADREITTRGKQIMPETEFSALSVGRGLGFLGLHRRSITDYFSYLLSETS